MVEHDEHSLVQGAMARDRSACEDLVSLYGRMVGTVIWRATGDDAVVEDLSQEAFLKVFRALPSFDRRGKLSTWIYTIAHRVAIDHLRKMGRWRVESFTSGEEDDGDLLERLPSPAGLDPEATLLRSEAGQLVRNGLARLPDKYRIPLVYSAIEGLAYPTIAEMLGIPVGTVKTLVFRGKKLLRLQILSAVQAEQKGADRFAL